MPKLTVQLLHIQQDLLIFHYLLIKHTGFFFESKSGVGTGTAELEFQLNGTIVSGTQSRATNQKGGSTVSLSSRAVLSTGAAPNILTLVNTLMELEHSRGLTSI